MKNLPQFPACLYIASEDLSKSPGNCSTGAMTRTRSHHTRDTSPIEDETVREILGYLNFSNGTPDVAFQRNINLLYASLGGEPPAAAVKKQLVEHLARLQPAAGAFADSRQAEQVLRLTFDAVLPAYWRHHADLLFHIRPDDIPCAFFTARVIEAVLEQGAPWDETERVVTGTLNRLNDYLGYRPVAVLENGQRMEPYANERFRPLPLYLRGVGVATGRYERLIERTIAFFSETPEAILRDSYFDLSLLDELALDLRAHDHTHPVTKRTNYTFGEWDPHHLDNQGRYRRFIIRKILADSLLDWMNSTRGVDPEELIYDASAVLCGTMLMASSISGSGPDTHDSTISLTSLLPKVARQRDAFYARLLDEAQGARAKRLRQEAKLTQQPFGHVRQHLNITLAKYGASQVQHRHLAQLFAEMGYADASVRQAAIIPSPSARFESEIAWRVTAVHRLLDHGHLAESMAHVREIVDLIHRGIGCGAIVDPWNILGFQGQFPLFSAREDSIPDHRVFSLLDMIEQSFGVYSHALSEAAAQNDERQIAELQTEFRDLAEWWDRYATTAVADLPPVSGMESVESASRVAQTLLRWRSAGEAAGDISFWRTQVDRFESAKAYALVIDALLRKQDLVASMGLLVQWLSTAPEVGLDSGPYSIQTYLFRWMSLATSGPAANSQPSAVWTPIRRLFDSIEANAGTFWKVPPIDSITSELEIDDGIEDGPVEENAEPGIGEYFESDDDESDLFGAAYDGFVFRDSAEDGHSDSTVDGGYVPGSSEMEVIAKLLEPRLRFFETLAQLWQTAATHFASRCRMGNGAAQSKQILQPPGAPTFIEVVSAWLKRTREVQADLFRLCLWVHEYELLLPAGDHDSNVEFDVQRQTKFYLLHSILAAHVRFRTAERCLRCCLPPALALDGLHPDERSVVQVFRGILHGDVAEVRQALPKLMDFLSRSPLLYVAFEHGGRPEAVRDVRMLQSVIRFLVAHLPRMGFLNETWQLLQTVYRMERKSRPDGLAVTEFDSYFRAALKNTLRCVVRSSARWPAEGLVHVLPVRSRLFRTAAPARRQPGPGVGTGRPSLRAAERFWLSPLAPPRRSGRRSVARRQVSRPPRRYHQGPEAQWVRAINQRDELLVGTMNEIVERYMSLWLKHSRTMRLSSVEELNQQAVWRDVRKFVANYGADLFQARMLTLGNIRTILHNGVERFLDYLDENRDPLHPVKLIEDLDDGKIDPDRAAGCLELIYESLVDKFERFVEYNTTTTQSDYGEMIYSLLDFLRTESTYDRDAWNLTPVQIAHEVLTELGRNDAALVWETLFAARSADLAERNLRALRRLEKKYGMRLPSLADRFNERFVKPMAVNRMLALVPHAVADARRGRASRSFERLQQEIDKYLETTTGSSIDVPPWLRSFEREVDKATENVVEADLAEPGFDLPPVLLSWKQTQRRIEGWK